MTTRLSSRIKKERPKNPFTFKRDKENKQITHCYCEGKKVGSIIRNGSFPHHPSYTFPWHRSSYSKGLIMNKYDVVIEADSSRYWASTYNGACDLVKDLYLGAVKLQLETRED